MKRIPIVFLGFTTASCVAVALLLYALGYSTSPLIKWLAFGLGVSNLAYLWIFHTERNDLKEMLEKDRQALLRERNRIK